MPRRPGTQALLVFLVAILVYNANLRYIASFDSLASSLLPFRILSGHGLTLEEPKGIPPSISYSIVRSRTGSWVSFYPVVTPLLVTPLYVPAAVWVARGGDPEIARVLMEKLAASVVAAGSAAVLFLVLLRLTRPRFALLLTAAYAFGTSTFTISSQALWQHGPAELLLAILLWLVVCHENGPPMVFARMGAVAALLSADRPPNVVFALALAVWCALRHPRRLPLIVAGAMPVAALVVAYDLVYFHTWLGSYGGFVSVYGKERTPLLPGIAARLLAPGIGLLVYSPFFIFLLLLLRRSPHPALDAPPSPTRGEGGLPSPPACMDRGDP